MEAAPAAGDGLEAVAPNSLAMNPFTLAFKSAAIEAEYLCDVAKRRWPVLIFIFCFDVACFLFRFIAKLYSSRPLKGSSALDIVFEMGHQLTNMVMLYVLIGLLNKRARKTGSNAARQEEVLLSACMALAICNLLASLRADNGQDYVYMAYFLICTSSFLKIRWWVGTGVLVSPTVAVHVWYGRGGSILPPDAVVHIVVAWAVGGLMTYLADWYRRQTFANQKLALAAHEKELLEARARMQAQRELAAAQAQAAQRALSVAREKAAHEAKNEFMSLMCHEVRTPLNGCLASAEMLLETPLAEEQRELAKTIQVSGSILLSTVSNFLDFFKLEAGKQLDIVRTLVSLPELVGDVHCIIEAMVGRGGSLALRPPALPADLALVYCDPDRLRGILLNLYTNAAKFTKCGSISLRVRVVEPDYEPEPPPGWAGITITPSYCTRPSTDVSRVSWSRDSVDQGLRKLFGSSGNLLSPATSSCNLLAAAAAAAAAGGAQTTTTTSSSSSSGGAAAAGSDGGAAAPAAAEGPGSAAGSGDAGSKGKASARRGSGQVVHLVAEPAAPRRSFSAPSLQRPGLAHQPSPLSTSSTPLQAAAAGDSSSSAEAPEVGAAAAEASSSAGAASSSSSSGTWGWPPQSFAKGLRHRLAAAAAAKSHWRLGGRDSQEVSHLTAAAAGAGAAAGVGYPRPAAATAAGPGGGVSPEASSSSTTGSSALPPLPPAMVRADEGGSASTSGRPSLGIPGGVRSNALPGGAAAAGRVRWLLFEVMDTGVGITEDALQTLFRQYVQGTDAEMAKPRATGGTGLGLSICSKQVGVLGGCIGAQSATGVGSTFWFKIPVIAGDMEPAWGHHRSSSSAEPEAAAAAAGAGPAGASHSRAGAGAAPPPSSGSSSGRPSLTHWGPGRKGIRWQWQQEGLPPGASKAAPPGQQQAAAAAGASGPAGSSHPGSPDSSSTAAPGSPLGAAAVAGVAGSSKGQAGAGGEAGSCGEGAPYILAGPPAPPPSSTMSSGGTGGNSSNRSSWENGGQPRTDTSSSSSNTSSSSDSSGGADPKACRAAGGGGATPPVGALGYRPAPPSVCDPASSSLYALECQLPPRLQQTGRSAPQQQKDHAATSSSTGSSPVSVCSPSAAAAVAGACRSDVGRPSSTGAPAHLLPPQQQQPSSSGSTTSGGAHPPPPAAAPQVVSRPTGVSFDGRRSTQLDTSCLTGKRVLLAEDNLINQTVARKMLSSLGMTVEVAVNGLEALNAVQRCVVTSDTTGSPGDPGFDIILMDMAMPVMGGVEATRAIRAAGHRLPIVAMTANASDKDRDECADSGMDGFLSKPVLREQLARALLAVLGPGAGAAGGVPPF